MRVRRPIHGPRRAKTVRYAAPALEKGLDILELLAADPAALTSSEILSSQIAIHESPRRSCRSNAVGRSK